MIIERTLHSNKTTYVIIGEQDDFIKANAGTVFVNAGRCVL